MAHNSILVVEDNERLRRFMCNALEKAGYTVFRASSAPEAFKILKEEFLDLVLLDLMLGDSNGIEILKTVRRQDEDMPVMIVSSVQDQETKVDGFALGCDDFVTKPFYIDELLGRIKRILKRARPRLSEGILSSDTIESGPFVLNIQNCSVVKKGQPLPLRKKLFELFLFFVRHPGMVLSNEVLFDRAWDSRDGLNSNSLYVHIRQLRKIIEDDAESPYHIKTVRGVGYVYTADGNWQG